jgi:hypothetical protein
VLPYFCQFEDHDSFFGRGCSHDAKVFIKAQIELSGKHLLTSLELG